MQNIEENERLKEKEGRLFLDYFEELESTDGMLDKHYECPICFSKLTRTGRCETCPKCGWSTCSL